MRPPTLALIPRSSTIVTSPGFELELPAEVSVEPTAEPCVRSEVSSFMIEPLLDAVIATTPVAHSTLDADVNGVLVLSWVSRPSVRAARESDGLDGLVSPISTPVVRLSEIVLSTAVNTTTPLMRGT